MEKLVFINACIRKEKSRTLRLAMPILSALRQRYEIEEIDLTDSSLYPVTTASFCERGVHGISRPDRELGELVSDADRIVVAAPFWDMSFPSVLKVFFEHISAPDITFKNNDDGTTTGICKSKKVLYITTRGMEIETDSPLDQGTSYLRALSWLWGLGEISVVSVCGADVYDKDKFEELFEKAIEKGLKICEEF